MARRGRVIGATAILCFLFLLSFRKSGSHPRDLRTESFHDSLQEKQSHLTIKEPPGQWDPIEDKFKDQQKLEEIEIEGVDELIDTVTKVALELSEERIQRKTPQKGAENGMEDAGPGVVLKKPAGGVDESGVVAIGKEEVGLKKYDPAQGIILWSVF